MHYDGKSEHGLVEHTGTDKLTVVAYCFYFNIILFCRPGSSPVAYNQYSRKCQNETSGRRSTESVQERQVNADFIATHLLIQGKLICSEMC